MRVARVDRTPEAPHRATPYSVPSPTAVSTADLHNTLSMAGRRVALRFRDRPGEVVYAEVLEPLHRNACTCTPWGTAVEWTFDARDLRSVLVATVERHADYTAICQRQRVMAREGRFA